MAWQKTRIVDLEGEGADRFRESGLFLKCVQGMVFIVCFQRKSSECVITRFKKQKKKKQ
jgi:hypothetical protein